MPSLRPCSKRSVRILTSPLGLSNIEPSKEGDLLLVEAELRSGGRLSLGVRNSGTEAKTSISLRTSVPLGEQERSAFAFMESIRIILEQALIP